MVTVFETVSVDDVLFSAITDAIAMVGPEGWSSSPLITFEPSCFPDPWAPTLQGVRTALRRFLRHAGLPELPVVVEDHRKGERGDAPVVDPVAFSGIEDGRAHFAVFAINEPEHLAAWLCLEVVRAWAEYRGITRDEPLAYRAIPTEDLPPQPEAVLDASSATVIAIGLGLGPVLAAGSVQSHRRETLQGAWVQTQWSQAVVGGFPPPVLARLLAMYAVTRASDEGERAILRNSLPEDVHSDFDDAIDELDADAEGLRVQVGLPAQAVTERRPIDDAPLPEEPEDAGLVEAERAHEHRNRHFNEGRRVFRVVSRGTWLGAASGAALGGLVGGLALASVGAGAIAGAVAAAASIGGWLGHGFLGYRCSDPDCAGRPTAEDRACPSCHGVIVGELTSADQRLDHEDEDADAVG